MKLTFLWLLACSSKPPEAAAPTPATPEPVRIAPAAPTQGDPQALYAACEARVEQPQQAGECGSDDDCQKTGCSEELCVARSHGAMMTTCEVQPCFAVLQACGCRDGQCTWSVAATGSSR